MGSKVIRFNNLKEKIAPNFIDIFETEKKLCRKLGFTDETDIVVYSLFYLEDKFTDVLEYFEEEIEEDEALLAKYMNAAADFYSYFFETYEENEGVMEAIDEMVEEDGEPIFFILSLGATWMENQIAKAELEDYDNLDKNLRDKFEKFIDYVWSIRKNRHILLLTDDDEYLSIDIKKTIPKEDWEVAKNTLRFFVKRAYDEEWPLLLLYGENALHIFDVTNKGIVSFDDESYDELREKLNRNPMIAKAKFTKVDM